MVNQDIPLELGRLVVSKAGRDKGRCMMVVRLTEEPYVYVADGKLRKLSNPKKKKRMHLYIKPYIDESIASRLREGQRVFEYEIRAAIEKFGFDVKPIEL